MANNKSAIKIIISNETKKQKNKYQQKTTRTVIKKLEQETKKATAVKKLPEAVSMIDKLSKNNIIHKNKAAHLKSKLTKKVNSLK